MRKTLPGLQLDDSIEAEIMREVANAPWHDSNFGRGQCAKSRSVEMIEVRMRQKHEMDRRQIADPATGPLDPIEKKKPVREIWIIEDIEVAELNVELGMSNPGQGLMPIGQFCKNR